MRQIGQALSDAATLRGGSITKDSLRLYTQRLAQRDTQDVLNALKKLADLERKEYEPAIPEIHAIFAMVDAEETARHNRAAATKSERLVRWQCPECKVTISGFPPITADITNKRCQSKYKPFERGQKNHDSLPNGQICGARMTVIHDDADVSEDSPVVKWVAPWAERSGAR